MPASRSTALQNALSMLAADPSTPAPTYGQPERLEQALDRAVLAEGPVQHGEDDVDLARRRAVRAHQRAAPAPGTSDVPPPVASCAGGTPSRGREQRGRAVHDLPAAGVVDQQRHDVVAAGVERLDHRAGRGQRDRVLRGAAAGDHGDAHARGSWGRRRSPSTARVEPAHGQRDLERLGVGALDVLIEHDPVLRRLGDRLVDDLDVAASPPAGSARPASTGDCARRHVDGARAVREVEADRGALAHEPARLRRLLRDLIDLDVVRAAAPRGLAARSGRPTASGCARLVLGLARRVRHLHRGRAGGDPDGDAATRRACACRAAGSVRVTWPLSVVSLASDCRPRPRSRCRAARERRRRVSSTMSGMSFCPRETLSRTVSPGCSSASAGGTVATTMSASAWASRTRWRLVLSGLTP